MFRDEGSSKVLHCPRCGDEIPAGVLVCIACSIAASGQKIGKQVQANLRRQFEINPQPGTVMGSKGKEIIRQALPSKPQRDPKRIDTGDNFEFPNEPLRIH